MIITDTQLVAATRIQSVFRQYNSRRWSAVIAIQCSFRGLCARTKLEHKRVRLEQRARTWNQAKRKVALVKINLQRNRAATKIQTFYRGAMVRWLLRLNQCALILQTAYRGHQVRRLLWRNQAALQIQRAFRAKLARRRLLYLKNQQLEQARLLRMARGEMLKWQCERFSPLLQCTQAGLSAAPVDRGPARGRALSAEDNWQHQYMAHWQPVQVKAECRELLQKCEVAETLSEKEGCINVLL